MNTEEKKANRLKYYAENRDKLIAYSKQYHKTHKKIKQKNKENGGNLVLKKKLYGQTEDQKFSSL